MPDHLSRFSQICENSKEYQGDGWGCAYLENGEWQVYKNIQPIWQDDFSQFPDTTQFLAHARSAFQDTDVTLENNMPFHDKKYVFAFNGELRGVKIKAEGRIGAEKVFNTIKRFDRGDMQAALTKGLQVIRKRTDYVRAMNIIITDRHKVYVASFFGEDPEYFTLRRKQNGATIICSEPYPGESGWQSIPNGSIKVF